MKTLYAVTVVSMITAVSLVVVAEPVDKDISSSEPLLSTKLLTIGIDQKPTMRSRQECMSHLQEIEPRLVKNHGLLSEMSEIHKQP